MPYMHETASAAHPLVIVGEEDVVIGFKALGFKVYGLKEQDDVSGILDEVVQQKTAVCLLQDNFYLAAQNQLHSYRNLPLPVFIPFSKSGRMETLEEMVREIRMRATGVGQ